MKIFKKHLKVIIIALFCISGIFLFSMYWINNTQEKLVTSIKNAYQIDVYRFAKDKITLFSSIQDGNIVGETFGEENLNVFGRELFITNYKNLLYPKDAGILLRFRFPDSKITLDVYCHRIKVDTNLIENNIISAYFSDIDEEMFFLVEVDTGIMFSEPNVSTKRMKDPNGKFYEILDKSFFSDIMQLLKERSYLDS